MSDPAAPVLLTASEGKILRLTLNRPQARNALSVDLMTALEQALGAAEADQTIGAILIDAAGPAFCSGHDLKEMLPHRDDPDGGEAWYGALFSQCARLMQKVAGHRVPVIAAVHGIATAAGCQLVASCDLALATPDTRFATPGVNIGLFCSTPLVALTRNVGRKQAAEMLFTGEMIDAPTAERWGLINHVVPADQLMAEAMTLAGKIAARSSAVVALGKRALNAQAGLGLDQAYQRMSAIMTANMLMEDAGIGIKAFLGKATPEWVGR